RISHPPWSSSPHPLPGRSRVRTSSSTTASSWAEPPRSAGECSTGPGAAEEGQRALVEAPGTVVAVVGGRGIAEQVRVPGIEEALGMGAGPSRRLHEGLDRAGAAPFVVDGEVGLHRHLFLPPRRFREAAAVEEQDAASPRIVLAHLL